MVLQIGNDTIAMRFIPLLIWITLLSTDSYESPILDPTFQFNYTSTEIDAGADSVGSFSGTIYNISSSTVTIAVVRRINTLAEGWTSSICVGATCYNESIDSVAVELSAGDSTACGVLIWINDVEGTGTVQLDLFDLDNSDEHIIVDLNIYAGTTVGIVRNESTAKQFELLNCYPNPFNSTITLSYNTNYNNSISITIYDYNGKYIKSTINHNLTDGTQTVRWDGTDQFSRPVAAGMYLYLIKGAGFRETGKMIYLK